MVHVSTPIVLYPIPSIARGHEHSRKSTIRAFIILVDESPHLTTITFGPGILTTTCFETCLNFLSLRHLELKEAKISIDFKLITAIGTLPELDTFVLDDRIGYYERGDSDKESLPNVGFLRLKKLHITGTLALIRLLYNAALGSEVLEDLGLTLVRKSAPSQCGLSGSHGKRKNKSLKGNSRWRSSMSSGETGIDSMTTDFFNLLKGLSRPVLKVIRLNHLQDYHESGVVWEVSVSGQDLYKPSPQPLDLPVAILDFLLGHTNLEGLEIAGWTLPETASCHKLLFSDTSNLQTICLPVSSKASTIRFIDLLSIAKSPPDLVFLHCGIESLSSFTSPPLSVEMPSHGLKGLSAGISES